MIHSFWSDSTQASHVVKRSQHKEDITHLHFMSQLLEISENLHETLDVAYFSISKV